MVDRIVQVYIDDFDKKKVSILFTMGSLEIYFRSSIEAFKWKNTIKFQYEKKEENIKTINKYVDKLKRNNGFFRPINILNRILSRTEIEEQNQFYKSEAVRLEKENIKNTELIFEKISKQLLRQCDDNSSRFVHNMIY